MDDSSQTMPASMPLDHVVTRHPRLSRRRLAALLCVTAVVGRAEAQAPTAPTYISSLTDYQVVAMSGAQAPTNGTSSMQSVTPSEWLTGDPSNLGLRGVIDAWSGGAKGTGSKLFVTGGGHFDSANNGLYVFDFSGTSQPAGWATPLVISPVSAVRAAQTTYADGKPSAIHTYDGMAYSQAINMVYRFGGAIYNQTGMNTAASFKFNVATNAWTRLPDYPSGPGDMLVVHDPSSGNIFVSKYETLSGHFFRTSNDTWSGAKSYGGSGFAYDSVAAWDHTRSRGIIVGAGRNYLVTANFTNETISVGTLGASGATSILNVGGPSAFYDVRRDVYWIFGGQSGSSGYANLYEMDARTFAITQHPLSQSMAAGVSGDNQGTFGRYVFMEDWRAIGFVATATSPPYVIKLPQGARPVPSAPNGLSAN